MKSQLITITFCIFSIFIVSFPFLTTAADLQLEKLENSMCRDAKTGLMWQMGKSKSFTSPKEAVKYAEDLVLADYSDWRLPTTDERKGLKNIFDFQRNGDCDLVRLDSSYWTDDEKKGTQPGKLEPNDQCGGGYDFIVKKKGYVRVVRP